MKIIKTVFVLGLLLNTTSVLADSASASEAGVFDTVLPGGMSISQTLEEWDRSAMRYRNEPPALELDDVSTVEEDNPQPNDDGKQS